MAVVDALKCHTNENAGTCIHSTTSDTAAPMPESIETIGPLGELPYEAILRYTRNKVTQKSTAYATASGSGAVSVLTNGPTNAAVCNVPNKNPTILAVMTRVAARAVPFQSASKTNAMTSMPIMIQSRGVFERNAGAARCIR